LFQTRSIITYVPGISGDSCRTPLSIKVASAVAHAGTRTFTASFFGDVSVNLSLVVCSSGK
jgi:hypothetical protein